MVKKIKMKNIKKIVIKSVLMVTLIIGCIVAVQADVANGANGKETSYLKIEDSLIGNQGELHKFIYSGIWKGGAATDCSNGDEHYSNKNVWGSDSVAPSYSITFMGTGISLYGNKAPALGIVEVYLDGEILDSFNAENSTRITQQLLYRLEGLDNKEHTIKVVNTKKGGTLNGIHIDYALVTQMQESQDDSMVVTPSQLILVPGKSKEIKAILKDGIKSDILWESKDPNIASVESGKVTAQNEGTTQITVICEKTNISFNIPVIVERVQK